MKRLIHPLTIVVMLIVTWLALTPSIPPTLADDVPPDHLLYLPVVSNDFDSAWSWSSVLTPTLTPSPSDMVMALDNTGRPHILWDTYAYGQQFIYHTYLGAQGWMTPTAILPTLGTSYIMYPPIVGPDGKLHLLWRNQASSNGQQYYRLLYATFDGVSWGPEQEVYSASGIYSLRGMPDLDSTGKVHATFLVGSLFSTSIYHNALESTGWSTPVNVPIPSMYIGYETVWPDQKGGVKIYYDTTDDKMHYFHWRNNQFYVNDHQFSGSMGSHDTQLDAQTNLHTFWTSQVPIPGGTTTGIYYQCLNNNFIWGTQQVLSGQNSAGNLHSASDRVSDVAIAWNEANTKIRLGIWRGCNQTDMKTVPLLATNSSLKAVALSPDPKKACVLASRSGYPVNYNVICADINR